MVKLSFSIYPIPFEDSWWIIDFNIKMTSPTFFLANVFQPIPSLGHQNYFLMAMG